MGKQELARFITTELKKLLEVIERAEVMPTLDNSEDSKRLATAYHHLLDAYYSL